jgi:hypothetical protein
VYVSPVDVGLESVKESWRGEGGWNCSVIRGRIDYAVEEKLGIGHQQISFKKYHFE